MMAEQVSRRPANVSAALIGLLAGVICVAVLAVYMIVGVSTTPQEGLGALIAGVWVALGLVFAALAVGLALAIRFASRRRRSARTATTVLGVLTALLVFVVIALGLYGWIQWAGGAVSVVILVSVVLLWVGRSDDWWL